MGAEIELAPRESARTADPRVSEYFDQSASYWDQIYAGRRFINWHLAHRRQLVIDAVRRLSNGRSLRVLDLGSGSGVLTRDLVRMGHAVVALDCSEKMIRTLLHSMDGGSEGQFLGAVLGSAAATGLRSESFDLIICVGVIQYQRQPAEIFREISRLLKPGGSCVFTLPNQLSLHHLLDPWCLLRHVYRLAVRRRLHAGGLLDTSRTASDRAAFSSDIYERRYFRREIPALARGQSLAMQETIAFGYGPLTVGNQQIFPDRISIAMSQALARLSQSRVLAGLSSVANRWVVVATKQPPPCVEAAPG